MYKQPENLYIRMTDADLKEWIDLLRQDKNHTPREIINDLVRNASVDEMSMDDREICRRALNYLDRTEP